MVHLTRVAEEIGAGHLEIQLRNEADLEALKAATNPIDFLAATGRSEEERRLMVNHVCAALLPDMLHFIHGGLDALEKRKFTLAFSLFRKPFKEGLPLLALMCADETKFFQNLKADPRKYFDGQEFNAPAKKAVIMAAIEKCDGMDFAKADTLYSILFDYRNEFGLAGLFDKATHLFTRRTGNATEDYNINFIFKDPRDNDIYESCYQHIAYVLLFIHLLQIELLSRMDFPKDSYLDHLTRTSVGAFEVIFGTGRSRMVQFFNREFREFMECPVCGKQINLRKSTAAKFFLTEMLTCNRCGHEHQLPVSWIFSRASEDDSQSNNT
jgi:predicted RNA-binding Zn-ribbon protein involved in translation (DUF1610 family)